MKAKNLEFGTTHHGREKSLQYNAGNRFNYGPLERIPRFTGTHPAVMREWMARFDWADELLQQQGPRDQHRHDLLKYRVLSWIEQHLLAGKVHLGARGYRLVRP